MRSLKRVTLHSILVSALITLSMAAMALGARPAEAAPFAYVVNTGPNTVSVIATASNTVVATIPVGNSRSPWVIVVVAPLAWPSPPMGTSPT
jgi:YVTN family beta-propeller protein